MRYHNITKEDMLNGDGLRSVLWLAGCNHQCKNCQNPVTWDINGGLLFDNKAQEELFDSLKPDYITGVTFSGGDPLHPQNRDEVLELAKDIREKFPTKDIWLYTGYLWDEFKDDPRMNVLDVFVDGEFVEELKDVNLPWVGSSNQRVIDVYKTLESGQIVLHKS